MGRRGRGVMRYQPVAPLDSPLGRGCAAGEGVRVDLGAGGRVRPSARFVGSGCGVVAGSALDLCVHRTRGARVRRGWRGPLWGGGWRLSRAQLVPPMMPRGRGSMPRRDWRRSACPSVPTDRESAVPLVEPMSELVDSICSPAAAEP